MIFSGVAVCRGGNGGDILEIVVVVATLDHILPAGCFVCRGPGQLHIPGSQRYRGPGSEIDREDGGVLAVYILDGEGYRIGDPRAVIIRGVTGGVQVGESKSLILEIDMPGSQEAGYRVNRIGRDDGFEAGSSATV